MTGLGVGDQESVPVPTEVDVAAVDKDDATVVGVVPLQKRVVVGELDFDGPLDAPAFDDPDDEEQKY